MSAMADLETAIDDFRAGRDLNFGQAALLRKYMEGAEREARIRAMFNRLQASVDQRNQER